jgi:hypothetical protein
MAAYLYDHHGRTERWLHLSASILLASQFLFEAAIVLPATRKSSAAMGHLLDTIQATHQSMFQGFGLCIECL